MMMRLPACSFLGAPLPVWVFVNLFLLASPVPQICRAQEEADAGDKVEPRPLDKFMERQDVTWNLTPEQVLTYFPDHGFEWLSTMKTALRSTDPGLRLFEMPVGETVIRSEDGKVTRIDISLYNVGDNGAMKSSDFSEMRSRWRGQLQDRIQAQPEDPAKATNSVVGLSRTLWYTDNSAVLLESGAQSDPEFLRLRLAPKPSGAAYLGNADGTTNKVSVKSDLRRNVARETSGDNVIQGLPMVDQGPKGYCAVACAERLFRYYGLEVDQHEMAQISESSASQGTSPRAMMDALGKVASKLNLRARTHVDWEADTFLGLIEDYNREADRQKQFDKRVEKSQGRVIFLDEYYSSFDPEVLQSVRTKGNQYSKFKSEVPRYIDQGVPLLWSVFLGVFEEKDIPQASGGHMRIIIGYNNRTNELLYTDTWGEGHELKRMSMDRAFTITTGLHSIQPSR